MSFLDSIINAVKEIADEAKEALNKETFDPADVPAYNQNNMPTSSGQPGNIQDAPQDQVKDTVYHEISANGSVKEKEGYHYNGAVYDKETGQILGDTHGHEGVYDSEGWEKGWDAENGVAVFEQISRPTTSSSSSSSRPSYSKPSPPPKPPKIEWNEPFPTFSSDIKTIHRYTYHLGLDGASFGNVTFEEASVFVTASIEVGLLQQEDYLMLEADFEGNVEFYILDGHRELAILPLSQYHIEDEKLFYGLPTRFIVNDQLPVTVKKNGLVAKIDYETVLNTLSYWNSNDSYSLSYTPILQNTYVPIEKHVRIKAIIRGIGRIKHLSLRHYSENHYAYY